ncbi:MAG: hypothetical protein Q8K86_04275 [Candidatus Nanopelagicaceae bacterium]|nr:hypothetical protein [Candidatus Nanopelagicaceae bacterium]
MNFSEVVAAYSEEFPTYVALADFVVGELREAVRLSGVSSLEITGRAKEPLSFGIKACLGRKYQNPLVEIEDKAGIRVIVKYERDVEKVVTLVQQVFISRRPERKLEALEFDKNGYLGTHIIAQLTLEQEGRSSSDFVDRPFEIQIRTIAQSAWAEVSHAELYKPPADVPDQMKRRIYRLVALVELFDNEVEGFVVTASQTKGYREAIAVSGLIEILARYGNTRKADRRLTAELTSALVPLYGSDVEEAARIIMEFTKQKEIPLRNIISEAEKVEDRYLNPILAQPELPMICERLEKDRYNLEANWPDEVPFAWLDDLAESWGVGRSSR